MNKIKGIAQITLYDKNNNIIKKQEEENMITDSIEQFIAFNKKIYCNQNLKKTTYVDQANKCFGGFKNAISGLLLFEDKLPLDSSVTNHNKISIASGGTKNDLSNPLIGSLNELESGETTVDGKSALRYTWDFGTSNANCTFNSICLTTKSAGNRAMPYHADFYREHPMGTDTISQGYCIRDNGDIFFSGTDDKIYVIKKAKEVSLNTKFSVFSEKNGYQLAGWSDISANGFIENDIYYVCAKNTGENKFYIIGINMDNMSVIHSSKKELPNLTTLGSLKYFGLIEDLFITNPRKSSSNLVWDVIDFSDNTFTSAGYASPFGALSSFHRRYCKIYKANGKYLTHFCTQYHTSSGWGTSYYSSTYLYKDTSMNRHQIFDANNSSPNFFLEKACLDFNNGNIIISTNGSEYIAFGGLEPLFTINNLDAPVTKTEANTMKITYTLIFD